MTIPTMKVILRLKHKMMNFKILSIALFSVIIFKLIEERVICETSQNQNTTTKDIELFVNQIKCKFFTTLSSTVLLINKVN